MDSATLRRDYASIVQLVDANATRLTLAMKAPVTWEAVPVLVKDLEVQTNNLISCTTCFSSSAHGRAYIKFIRSSTTEIVASLEAFIQSFIVSMEPDAYLPAIGTVHECIDLVKANLDAIPDNNAAVCKRWAENAATLNDALSEIVDLVEGNVVSGGWDDLGLEPLNDSEELSMNEKEVCKKARLYVKLANLIHTRVLSTLLHEPSRTDLDDLLAQSDNLSALTDDFVSFLHPPQDFLELRQALEKMASTVSRFGGLFATAQGKDAIWQDTFDRQFEQSKDALDTLITVQIELL